MARLKYLMIHCTGTPAGRNVDKDDIFRWHTAAPPEGRGWSVPGYSRFIKLNGEVQELVEVDEDNWIEAGEITNGAQGYNGVTKHIAFAGGSNQNGDPLFDDFDRILTPEQFTALQGEVLEFLSIQQYNEVQVLGHNQVNDHKYCPALDVRKFLGFLEVPEKYIYQGPILIMEK